MAKSRFMTIAVALICAISVSVAAQSGGTKDKKKDDGAVTTTAKGTAKATAGGAMPTVCITGDVANPTATKR
jgi:uncharacterized protein YggE